MKTQKRHKLCLNCNGSVDLEVVLCPYCGHDLLTEKKEDIEESLYKPASRNMTPNQTIASLYPPAYHPPGMEEKEPRSKQVVHDPSSMQDPFQQTAAEEPVEKMPGAFFPILVFSLGAFLAALGFFIFFFSTNGYAILKWNAKYWFVYFLMALPLLVWGYQLLNRLDTEIDNSEAYEEDHHEEDF